MGDERLERQIGFIIEIDRLKTVLRRTMIARGDRPENSAEHSWHLAMMAMVLAEHAEEKVDVARVIRLVLVHDIVEIDAGDTYAYDEVGNAGKAVREQQAAARLFGLLPADQRDDLLALWREFEARTTAEARFANALDRVMPLIHNVLTGGAQWEQHGVVLSQVQKRMAAVKDGSEPLARYVEGLLARAVADGLLPDR